MKLTPRHKPGTALREVDEVGCGSRHAVEEDLELERAHGGRAGRDRVRHGGGCGEERAVRSERVICGRARRAKVGDAGARGVRRSAASATPHERNVRRWRAKLHLSAGVRRRRGADEHLDFGSRRAPTRAATSRRGGERGSALANKPPRPGVTP